MWMRDWNDAAEKDARGAFPAWTIRMSLGSF